MATEQLQLGTDDALLREIGDELMAEEMRIDPLREACGVGILFDDLAEPPGGVGLIAIGFKEIGPPCALLTFHILREFTAETRGKKDIPILVAFALANPQVTGREIHIREAEPHQFGIAHAREQQQFEHDDMGQLACLPDRLVERHQFGLGQQLGQPLGLPVWLHLQQLARILEHFFQIVVSGCWVRSTRTNFLAIALGGDASSSGGLQEGRLVQMRANSPYGLTCS